MMVRGLRPLGAPGALKSGLAAAPRQCMPARGLRLEKPSETPLPAWGASHAGHAFEMLHAACKSKASPAMRGVEIVAIIAVLITFGLVRIALFLHGAAWGASTSFCSSRALPLQMLCLLPHSSALWRVPCLSQALLGRPYLAYFAACTLGAPSAVSGAWPQSWNGAEWIVLLGPFLAVSTSMSQV